MPLRSPFLAPTPAAATFSGLDGKVLRRFIDEAISERTTALGDHPIAFASSDWKIVQMLWPHLEALASLFELAAQENEATGDTPWQIDHIRQRCRNHVLQGRLREAEQELAQLRALHKTYVTELPQH
ncbi:MAG: hypothetical protein KKC85_00040 [Gammaproteobacteria bacterium]|nr:hypothetical protein [Gammaproteobacteria bacterium]MBU1439944.1 hypothetical protein [Gammaproteobacteria bacterium]MBU2284804.1 hypothetical protein [Gammaproteobacteria bacterium]